MRRTLPPLLVLLLAAASLACLRLSAAPVQPVVPRLDGYTTSLEGILIVGEARQMVLTDYGEAHNWAFTGSSGDAVVIRVTGINGSDPHARLFDETGTLLGENDDSGSSLDAQITATLPYDGTYTIRIDMYTMGEYQVSLQRP